MTTTKELDQLTKRMRDAGRLVLTKYTLTEDGRTIYDSITILNTPGIGEHPMAPIRAAEIMREWLSNND